MKALTKFVVEPDFADKAARFEEDVPTPSAGACCVEHYLSGMLNATPVAQVIPNAAPIAPKGKSAKKPWYIETKSATSASDVLSALRSQKPRGTSGRKPTSLEAIKAARAARAAKRKAILRAAKKASQKDKV